MRQALKRIKAEAESLAQYQALAGNLGWEEMADRISSSVTSLAEAADRIAGAVEEVASVQAEAAEAHDHPHHHHPHGQQHPHKHGHGKGKND